MFFGFPFRKELFGYNTEMNAVYDASGYHVNMTHLNHNMNQNQYPGSGGMMNQQGPNNPPANKWAPGLNFNMLNAAAAAANGSVYHPKTTSEYEKLRERCKDFYKWDHCSFFQTTICWKTFENADISILIYLCLIEQTSKSLVDS